MNKITVLFTIALTCSVVCTSITASAETTSTTKAKKVSTKKSLTKKVATPEKKLPQCDEYIKDWGGRGGYTSEGGGSMGTIAPPGCELVFQDGVFVPMCEVDGKMVRQCEGGIQMNP